MSDDHDKPKHEHHQHHQHHHHHHQICFMADTLVRTPDGEALVQDLKIGDLVLTREGQSVPVRWIGRQTVVSQFIDELHKPIRVKARALEDNVPCRDLLVSPAHALLVDDVLIQAGALVNDISIVREPAFPKCSCITTSKSMTIR